MKRRDTIWALVFALALCVTGARAQDQQQNSQSASPGSPIPPMNSGGYSKPPTAAARGVSEPYDTQTYDPSQVVPDTNTLAGAQLFGVGSLDHARNVFDPSISFTEIGQTTPNLTGQSTLGSETLFNGILNFNRIWSRYHLTAIYNGGGTFNRGAINYDQQYHDVTVSQEIDWERWRLMLRDDFTATPGATFTGAGAGGPGLIAQTDALLGPTLNTIGQTFIPSETIETGNAMRYRNSVLGQAEYSMSRRSAFSFSGSYGVLDFTDAGYISSKMLNAQAGYDYLLDPKNSVAILGGYGKIDYTGTVDSTTDYMAALAYGRKITGRLAFQVGAGAQQVHSSSGLGNFDFWLQSITSALTYERRRAGIAFSFLRGLSAGSGVFLGAKTDTFTTTGHYFFTRFWTGTITGGYARNDSLVPAGVAPASFDNWLVGANLGRQIGPHGNISFNYGLHSQTSAASCPVTSCGISGNQQTFGITASWHFRPIG